MKRGRPGALPPRDAPVGLDDRLRDERRRVDAGRARRGQLRPQAEGPVERMGIGVDEQFRRIEPMAVRRVVGPFRPQPVTGARPEPGDEAAEDVAFLARQHEAGGFLFAALVEQAERDALARGGRRRRR